MTDRIFSVLLALLCWAAGLASAFWAGMGPWVPLAQSSAQRQWYLLMADGLWWAPPAWVFGIVWTILYLMMGWVGARLWALDISRWKTEEAETDFNAQGYSTPPSLRLARAIFLGQLMANLSWSPLFFRWRLPAYALGVLAVLHLFILMLGVLFWRYDRKAAWLWTPYVAWVTFAFALSIALKMRT